MGDGTQNLRKGRKIMSVEQYEKLKALTTGMHEDDLKKLTELINQLKETQKGVQKDDIHQQKAFL